MDERQTIEQAYKDMYTAMSAKDSAGLDKVLADDFVLVHMTGMRQSKVQFIKAVMSGVLNYYEFTHESITVSNQSGDTATLCGKTRVTAAVFGGGRHTWNLQQDLTLKKTDGRWLIILAEASMF